MSNYYKPRFTPDSIRVINQIIFTQDILTTGLADCLRNLDIQEYDEFKKKFMAIPIIADQLIRECRALLALKEGKAGQKPKWFEWAEDILHFALNVQRATPTIRRENRRNDWEVIESRLEEIQRQCVEKKNYILSILPPPDPEMPQPVEVNSQAVAQWIGLVNTAQAGGIVLDAEGFRYRGRSS